MCEPHHSIVQVPDFLDDHDDDDKISPQSGSGSLTVFLSKAGQKLKKFGKFFHVSKMGNGHHATVNSSGVTAWNYERIANAYEAEWWSRTVKEDWPINQRSTESREAAFQYANAVSIGNLTALRSFLSNSIMLSTGPGLYVEKFHDSMLNNPKNKNKFKKELKEKLGLTIQHRTPIPEKVLEKVCKFVLGWTRKRKALVPEWADDKKLWLPSKKLITEI